jgi:hypothetical protein
LLRRDFSSLRANPQADSDPVTSDIGSLLQRMAGTSVHEVDRLIDELNGLRETVSSEGERVRREVVQYAALSQVAMQSTTTLAECMTRWSCGRA